MSDLEASKSLIDNEDRYRSVLPYFRRDIYELESSEVARWSFAIPVVVVPDFGRPIAWAGSRKAPGWSGAFPD